MGDSVLGAPRTESGDFRGFTQGDGQVLVPGDEPVRVGRFVEVDRTGRDERGGKVWADEVEDCGRGSQGGDDGIRQQAALAWAGRWPEGREETGPFRGIEKARDLREAGGFHSDHRGSVT